MNKIGKQDARLIERYLLWCFKTTQEDLDRIDRKFTQLTVDTFVLNFLQKYSSDVSSQNRTVYQQKLKEFSQYKDQKNQSAIAEKFLDKDQKALKGEYVFLQARLLAIKKAIVCFLGEKKFKVFEKSYQQEMINRILSQRDHC